MILRDVQSYLAEQHSVSLDRLATHFHTDADTVRPMLHKLVRKGRVRQLPSPPKCGECCQCDPAIFEVYEWVFR